ncbi:hypothetical protein BP6252_01538 [Coleophoma cylindrospora]|uniref:Uncharacterized protein n=1 Tax=Coleophoma cylindrospora TaxID=1849047 RepID=A0A3D8ST81_9HELO|nr:hypothetical protein BP6252_01538 [Coleophoma cylindrospora]
MPSQQFTAQPESQRMEIPLQSAAAAPSVNAEQPRPAEQMTAEPLSMRGGGEGDLCCGMYVSPRRSLVDASCSWADLGCGAAVLVWLASSAASAVVRCQAAGSDSRAVPGGWVLSRDGSEFRNLWEGGCGFNEWGYLLRVKSNHIKSHHINHENPLQPPNHVGVTSCGVRESCLPTPSASNLPYHSHISPPAIPNARKAISLNLELSNNKPSSSPYQLQSMSSRKAGYAKHTSHQRSIGDR